MSNFFSKLDIFFQIWYNISIQKIRKGSMTMKKQDIMKNIVTLLVAIAIIAAMFTLVSSHIQFWSLRVCENQIENLGTEASELARAVNDSFAALSDYNRWIVESESTTAGIVVREIVFVFEMLVVLLVFVSGYVSAMKLKREVVRRMRRPKKVYCKPTPRNNGHK